MWSLETIGYFSDEKDSQHYPSPFDLFYPTTGNFIGFIGNEHSRQWIQDSVRAFRQVAKVPSQGVAAPLKFKDMDRSDHWGFTQFGYPALMVTDTAAVEDVVLGERGIAGGLLSSSCVSFRAPA